MICGSSCLAIVKKEFYSLEVGRNLFPLILSGIASMRIALLLPCFKLNYIRIELKAMMQHDGAETSTTNQAPVPDNSSIPKSPEVPKPEPTKQPDESASRIQEEATEAQVPESDHKRPKVSRKEKTPAPH